MKKSEKDVSQMDILEIVNSHLKERELLVQNKLQEIITKLNDGETLEQLANIYKVDPVLIKDHLKKESYSFDLFSEKYIKVNQGVLDKSISPEQISTIPYRLYYGSNLTYVATQLDVSTSKLKEVLISYNYKRRWTYINKGIKSSIHPDILRIVNLLNTKKYSLQVVAELIKSEIEELKVTLKAANFQKVWTLESKVGHSTIETTIEGITIIRDLDTGIMEYIITNGKKYYTSYQISTILGINPTYYFNLASDKFILNKHFLQLSREVGNKIIQAIPIFNSKEFERLFSEQGLELLAEISKRNLYLSEYRKVDKPIVGGISNEFTKDTKEQISKEADQEKFTTEIVIKDPLAKNNNVSSKKYSTLFEKYIEEEESVLVEKIVKRLNSGENLYDISKEFVINRKLRVSFVTKLQFRLEDDGYTYHKVTKQWTLKNNEETNETNIQKELNKNLTINKVEENTSPIKKPEINEIVSFLNKENSFIKVEEKFSMKNQELRLLLKNKGYRYDGFFKLWTQKGRNTLLKEALDELQEGTQTYSGLEERGVNIVALKKEIQHRDDLKQVIETLKNRNDVINEEVKGEEDNSSEVFISSLNTEEIKTLRQMIAERQANFSNEQLKNNQVLEVTFKLDHQMLKQIDNFSDDNKISKSMVLEKALNQFFENNKCSYKNNHEVTKIMEEIIPQDVAIITEKEPNLRVLQKENPNNWDSAKERLLISAILEGTRKGRTLIDITKDVSQEIGISANACQSYWYSNIPKHYKEEYKQIILDQKNNWSEKDIQLLENLIFVEYAHLTPDEVLPIACKHLNRHISILRKKIFELLRTKRLQSD